MSVRSQLIGAAVCVVLGMAAAWIAQEWRHGAKQSRLEAAHARLLEQQAQAVVASVQAARNEEQRRIAALEEQRDNFQRMATAARADAAGARADVAGVYQYIRQILADARGRDPALADGGPAAGSPLDMLAYMLGRAVDRATELAEYADSARIAGLTCERSYDHVRSPE